MNATRMNQIQAFYVRPGHNVVLAAIEADVLF
jgi:hypothetical protein